MPNSERTEIEKSTLAKELKLVKLERMMEGESEELSNSISFDNCAGELEDRDLLPPVLSYFECLFG